MGVDGRFQGRYVCVHFKGKKYDVLAFAKHTETQEELVLYRPASNSGELFARPAEMFFGEVEVDGKKVPRFRKETQ